MNRITERISNEGLAIEKDYGVINFTYHGGRDLITYPAFEDLNHPESVFSLAHELGHHYQHKRSSMLMMLFIYLAKKNNPVCFIFYPFLIWWELDAWLKAWRICKEEKIQLDGFVRVASRAFFSYITSYFNEIFRAFKYVFGLYVGIVFLVRFLKVSEEMNLQQPEVLHSLRELVGSQSYNEVVSSMFTSILILWIFILCLYIGATFLRFNYNHQQSYRGKNE